MLGCHVWVEFHVEEYTWLDSFQFPWNAKTLKKLQQQPYAHRIQCIYKTISRLFQKVHIGRNYGEKERKKERKENP